jgi:hypothetical protein
VPSARSHLAVGAAIVAFAFAAVWAIAPPSTPSAAEELAAYIDANAQSYAVDAASTDEVTRDDYAASPGVQTLIDGGTNHDWAKLVLLFGGWPQSDQNVTVILRWMRQENYVDNWWNRNNPLNNGYGSGGGGGTGRFDNLVVAAQKVAENLHRLGGFQPIVDAFATSAPTEVTENAIWFSPWASGHYADGSHWHYTPVEVVTAPRDAWS